METMTAGSIDLVLTSPPYNTARAVKTDRGLQNMENRYISYEDQKTDNEYIEWTIDIFKGFNKVLKTNGCVLYNISYSSGNTSLMWLVVADIIRRTPLTVADCIVWKKKSAIPNNVSHNKLTRIVEYVFVICRKSEIATFNSNKTISGVSSTGQKNYNNMFNFIEAANNDGACKIHKATYSTELCVKLLNMYAPPNSTVFDPFLGTGTTGVAAKQLKHNFIGSEITQEYFEIAERRIENTTQDMFA